MVKCGQRRKRHKREEGVRQKGGEDLAGVTPVSLKKETPSGVKCSWEKSSSGKNKTTTQLGNGYLFIFPRVNPVAVTSLIYCCPLG